MSEKDPIQNGVPETDPEIIVNDYGSTKDQAVVIEEKDRTVLLTPNETLVIEKQPSLDIVPKNRAGKVYGGMWGPVQIAAAAAGALALLAVLLLYFFVVAPSNRELELNRAERDRLEREMISAKGKYGDITSTETQVAKLVSSVSSFESNFLPVEMTGKTALYQRLNGLIASYGLINTSGPDYAPLDVADQSQGSQSDEERGRSKFRSLFPGMYVTTTVEGSYSNLRRFISDIETGTEFVVISSIELEPSDSEQKKDAPNTAAPSGGVTSTAPGISYPMANQSFPQPQAERRLQGKTHGEVVRLRLEMAAYFRRPNIEPVGETAAPPAF